MTDPLRPEWIDQFIERDRAAAADAAVARPQPPRNRERKWHGAITNIGGGATRPAPTRVAVRPYDDPRHEVWATIVRGVARVGLRGRFRMADGHWVGEMPPGGPCKLTLAIEACCDTGVYGHEVTATKGSFSVTGTTSTPIPGHEWEPGVVILDVGPGGAGDYVVTIDSPIYPDPITIHVDCPEGKFQTLRPPEWPYDMPLTDPSVGIVMHRPPAPSGRCWGACTSIPTLGIDFCDPYGPTTRMFDMPIIYSFCCGGVPGKVGIARSWVAFAPYLPPGGGPVPVFTPGPLSTPVICYSELIQGFPNPGIYDFPITCGSIPHPPPTNGPAGPIYTTPFPRNRAAADAYFGAIVNRGQATSADVGDGCNPPVIPFAWDECPPGRGWCPPAGPGVLSG
jgi:hypothetical protein